MWGGISYITEIYSKANNKYMKKYDSSKENIFIIYIQTISMAGKWVNIFVMVDLSG